MFLMYLLLTVILMAGYLGLWYLGNNLLLSIYVGFLVATTALHLSDMWKSQTFPEK